jgi:VCBS repeat-containing protein
MNALKMAEAIARFRLLRSLGTFSESGRGQFTFVLDRSGRNVEALPHGAPRQASVMTVRQLFEGYNRELALLCQQYLRTEPSRGN